MTQREALHKALEALEIAKELLEEYDEMTHATAAIKTALEQEGHHGLPHCQQFNNWWNADQLTQNNPFREDCPAYWAWEGWQARAALVLPVREPLTDEQKQEIRKMYPTEDLCGWSYGLGVADAERHHGITKGDQT